jgi:hypothetical protein
MVEAGLVRVEQGRHRRISFGLFGQMLHKARAG